PRSRRCYRSSSDAPGALPTRSRSPAVRRCRLGLLVRSVFMPPPDDRGLVRRRACIQACMVATAVVVDREQVMRDVRLTHRALILCQTHKIDMYRDIASYSEELEVCYPTVPKAPKEIAVAASDGHAQRHRCSIDLFVGCTIAKVTSTERQQLLSQIIELHGSL